jgi:DNA repair protein RecN (Recombination protein N)
MKKDQSIFLESISLSNFATFENQIIYFDQKFNAIIGETGAGKSLIVDAFQIILGSRTTREMVRKGSKLAVVEAIFKCHDNRITSFLEEEGFPVSEEEIIIKKTISSEGKSKSYLNLQSCPANLLQKFARNYVDLVGQFDNQKLLTNEYQLSLVDTFGKLSNPLDKYQKSYNEFLSIAQEIENLSDRAETSTVRKEYLEFQIKLLAKINPSKERETELINKKEELLAQEKRQKTLLEVKYLMEDSPENILQFVGKASKLSNMASDEIPQATLEKILDAEQLLSDFSFEVSKLLNNQAENLEQNLETVLDELNQYQELKRKFSCSTDDLEQKLSAFEHELEELNSLERNLAELLKQKDKLYNRCLKMAEELHQSRVSISEKVEGKLTKLLRKLNMEDATFKIIVDTCEQLGPNGITQLSFMAETNKGEGIHPIAKIASGGELSRILLAVRQIVSEGQSISIFFFDEIDTGIGGKTAVKIADTLNEISTSGQVITVTHLPQIAKVATKLVYVEKETIEIDNITRTKSIARAIFDDERVKTLQEMAGLQ